MALYKYFEKSSKNDKQEQVMEVDNDLAHNLSNIDNDMDDDYIDIADNIDNIDYLDNLDNNSTNNSKDSKSSTTSLSKQAKKKSTQFYASSPKKKIKVIKRKPLTYLKEWEKQYSWLIYNEIQKKCFVIYA